MATILQSSLLTDFLYPFLLIFFIVFAILEKTKILGEGKQINAFTALVVGLIFVSAIFPKIIAQNLIMFMTVGLVVVFVVMMMWGFITGGTPTPGAKWKSFYAVLLIIVMVIVVIWATGLGAGAFNALQSIFTFLFDSSWSGGFWTNVLFVALIGGAIAIVLGAKKKVEGKD